MTSNKRTLLFEMIEENYGGKFGLRFSRSNSERSWRLTPPSSSGKIKQKSIFLNKIKKMVKFQNLATPKKSADEEFTTRNTSVFPKPNDGEAGDSLLGTKTDWWNPPQDSLPVEFCQDTSLHGLKYIGQPHRHLSERIFWLVAFLVGLSVATWLISEMWQKYKMNPVIVSFQPFETNVDQIPFPAVTVCNMNKVMKSKAEEFISQANTGDPMARRDVYYLDHVCSSTKSFAKRFNFSQTGELQDWQRERFKFNDTAFTENLTRVNEFLRRAAQNCSEMIPYCVWQDQELNCSKLFRPIETEFGKCCTFNMIPLSLLYTLRNDSREDPETIKQWEKWDIDHEGELIGSADEFPRKQMKAGSTNGLSFLLNANAREYYCTSSDSIGFRVDSQFFYFHFDVTSHLPVEAPKIADFGFSLKPGSEIFVEVAPQITMVDQDIFSFSLDKRNCYKTGEYRLKYYKYYSVNNCIEECIANATWSVCGCKRYYMPRNSTEVLCGPQKFECAEDVKYNKTKSGIRNTCKVCLPSCTEVYYEAQTTSTPLKKGIWNQYNGNETIPQWDEDNLSIVHVFVAQDSFYAKVRKELFGPTDLFANTGGLMGLCLGFSGLSLMEVIYFLTIRAWWKSRRKHVLAEDKSKWATTTVINDKTVRNTTGFGKSDPLPSTGAYYRSIFGEIRRIETIQ